MSALSTADTLYEYLIAPDEEAGWWRFKARLKKIEDGLIRWEMFPDARYLMSFVRKGAELVRQEDQLFRSFPLLSIDWDTHKLVRDYSSSLETGVENSREIARRLRSSVDEALPVAQYAAGVIQEWCVHLLQIRWCGCQPRQVNSGYIYAPELGILRNYSWERIWWDRRERVSCSLHRSASVKEERVHEDPSVLRGRLSRRSTFLVIESLYWPQDEVAQLELIRQKLLVSLYDRPTHGLGTG